MTVQVRSLNSDDFGGYGKLFEQVDELHRLELPEYFRRAEAPFRTQEYFEKLLKDPQALLLGAFQSGDLVGFAHVALVQIQGDGVQVPRIHVDR